MNKSIKNKLSDPAKNYRPLPFWSWNDRLTPDMVRYQIQEMNKAGLGGFFMHARSGLETEYLGTEWMDAIRAGIDEAEKYGMEPWVYDEDGWPSGFAGGLVCEMGDRYHGRWLETRVCVPEQDDLNNCIAAVGIIGIYSIESACREYRLLNRAEALSALEAKRECLIISHASNPYYIDVLSKEVVAAFIKNTHEAYKAEMPGYMKGAMKGFFTDEPRLSGRNVERDFPWSYDLEEAYEKEYSASLRDSLPSLFYRCGDYKTIRYRFWKIVNHMFAHSFMKQIGDWCRNNNSALTGHVMMEESIATQIANTGGVMPFYEFMDIPGIDWLRRTMSSPVVPKQVSSVAAQTGKKQVLTESFALCGWNAGFEDLKWVAQWQYVNGVNTLCQHLEGYTIRGTRKRDYPPSLFIQQPWWDKYELFNTFLSRIGMILRDGIQSVNVLVVHPMRSGWLEFDGKVTPVIKEIDKSFSALLETLSGQHIEYHLGDETVMDRHGSVSGGSIHVGECSYSTVIIPECLTLAGTTLDFVGKLAKQGGKVLVVKSLPGYEEGLPLKRIFPEESLFFARGPGDADFWNTHCKHSLSIKSETNDSQIQDIWSTSRVFEDSVYWYLVNNSRKKGHDAVIEIPDSRDLFLYDPLEDSYAKLLSDSVNCSRRLSLHMEPARSIVLVSGEKLAPENPVDPKEVETEYLRPGKSWDLEMDDPNVLTLDRCRYSINGGEWQDELEVIHLFRKLLDMRESCRLVMEFSFDSRLGVEEMTGISLVVEEAQDFSIQVNGTPVVFDKSRWWKDSSFKTLDISSCLCEGKNTIRLERDFYQSSNVYHVLFDKEVYETEKNKMTYDVELENIYLTGQFAVKSQDGFVPGGNGSVVTKGPFYLDKLPETVTPDNLVQEGLLFFSGKTCLHTSVLFCPEENRNLILSFKECNVSMMEILVNGEHVKNLLWAPWEADLTPFLADGENRITLILYGSNRNMLGPHHHRAGEPFSVGPDSFTGKWSWVEKATEADATNDEDRSRNLWDDRYAFVPFGVS